MSYRGRRFTFVVALLACSLLLSCKQRGDGAAAEATLSQLVDSLRNLPGTFSLEGAVWRFQGRQDVFVMIAGRGDSAVERLVECIDRSDSTLARVEGQSVLLGAMCLYALRHVAYATEYEDAPDTVWAGEVGPMASPEQLAAAKRAWLEVIRQRRYRLT